jgi:hypothetical protein
MPDWGVPVIREPVIAEVKLHIAAYRDLRMHVGAIARRLVATLVVIGLVSICAASASAAPVVGIDSTPGAG